jgi:ATP phosphoribosyltransferase regulatory subunit HisZ
MTAEPISFMDYWEAVDAAMLKLFAIDTGDAGIEADLIAAAQEEGQTPEDFALWFGEKVGLNTVAEWKALWGCP